MPKLILDSGLEHILQDSVVSSGLQTGLLLGFSRDNVDTAIAYVPTPPSPSGLAGEWNGEMKEWLLDHSEQVRRMLFGGMTVIGVFASGSVANLHKQKSFASCVRSASHTVSAASPSSSSSANRTFFCVIGSSDKLAAYSFEGKGSGVALSYETADVQGAVRRFAYTYKLSVAVHNVEDFSGETSVDTLSRTILSKVEQQLELSAVRVEGKIATHSTSATVGSWLQESKTTDSTYAASVLNISGAAMSVSQQQAADVAPGVAVCEGWINGQAFLLASDLASNLPRTIARDIQHSISSRLAVLEDELSTSESGVDLLDNVDLSTLQIPLVQLARRVAIPYQGIALCDYTLPSESNTEMQERVGLFLSVPHGQLHIQALEEYHSKEQVSEISNLYQLETQGPAPEAKRHRTVVESETTTISDIPRGKQLSPVPVDPSSSNLTIIVALTAFLVALGAIMVRMADQ